MISVPSQWGTDLEQKYISVTPTNKKLVVLFPGRNYSCDRPLLHFACSAAIQNGYDVLALEYGYQAARVNLEMKDLPKVVDDCLVTIRNIPKRYDYGHYRCRGSSCSNEYARRACLSYAIDRSDPVDESLGWGHDFRRYGPVISKREC